MKKLEIVELGLEITGMFGAMAIAESAIKVVLAMAPPQAKLLTKVCVAVGSLAIELMAAEAVVSYISNQFEAVATAKEKKQIKNETVEN